MKLGKGTTHHLGVVLVAVLAACGGEAGPGEGASGLEGPDVALPWSAETVFRAGGVDAPEWAAFGQVTDLSFDASGRVYVLDGQRRQVTVLSPAGEFVGTVGRPGEGPGELRFPSAMAVHPDGRVAVFDPGHTGFVVYGPDGAFLHNVRVEPQRYPNPEPPLSVTADGWIVSSNTTPRAEPETTRPMAAFPFAAGTEPKIVYRAWSPPTPPTREPGADITGGMRIRLPPVVAFHPGVLVAAAPGGEIAVVDSTAWSVKVLDAGGGGLRVLRRPLDPSPVTESVREAERGLRLEEAMTDPPRFVVSSADGGTAGAADDMARRFVEARIDGMGFHPVIPVVRGLGVDGAGRLWVERWGPEPGAPGPVDVVGVSGEYRGTLAAEALAMPDAFGPEGAVAYREVDALGAPQVRVARIREAGSR
jgi:hypothetical protein